MSKFIWGGDKCRTLTRVGKRSMSSLQAIWNSALGSQAALGLELADVVGSGELVDMVGVGELVWYGYRRSALGFGTPGVASTSGKQRT